MASPPSLFGRRPSLASGWGSLPLWGALAVFAATFGTYLATMPPSITWRNDGADGGELATAAYRLGIPHPPGYPTYVLVGRLFTLLPWGDIAHRLGVMSALFAAFTCGLVFLTAWRCLEAPKGWLARLAAALVASLSLAFSPVFWSQATIVEVYALNAAFAAALVYLTFPARERGPRPGGGALLGFVFGLGLGNHLSLALFMPMAAVALWPEGRDGPIRADQGLVRTMASFLLGLMVYSYLPLRARSYPVINWGGPGGTLWLIGARQYRELAFGLPLTEAPARLSAWASLLLAQFGLWGMTLALAGLWYLWRSQRRLFLASILGFALPSVYAIGYRTADSYIYLIPAYIMASLWLGQGVGLTFSSLADWAAAGRHGAIRKAIYGGVAGLLVLLPLVSLASNFPGQNLRGEREAYDYARGTLEEVASRALVVAASDRHTFALWYFRYGLMVRPDVAVLNAGLLQYRWYRDNVRHRHPELIFATESPDPRRQLLQLLAAQVGQCPIYLTFKDEGLLENFSLVETKGLYQVYPKGGGVP